jgi:hypothetical protein
MLTLLPGQGTEFDTRGYFGKGRVTLRAPEETGLTTCAVRKNRFNFQIHQTVSTN